MNAQHRMRINVFNCLINKLKSYKKHNYNKKIKHMLSTNIFWPITAKMYKVLVQFCDAKI